MKNEPNPAANDETVNIAATGHALTTIDKLAIASVEQLSSLKGKKREECNIAFWCGAATAYDNVAHPDAAWINRFIALVIATRGFEEVEKIAQKARDKIGNSPELPLK